MSTPNFALKNASRYFVFGMPVYYTQEEIDERELDQDLLGEIDELGTEFNYDADKDNVAYELKAKGWHDIEECDGDRSYTTTLFSAKTVSIMCGDNTIDITIQAGCTSGYYQAANFDWFVNIKTYRKVDYYYETCDYDYNDLTADDVIRDDWYENKGLSKIHAAHIIRKIESIIDGLKNDAELAFSKYCDEEMFCAWQAFNGEAGYSTAGKRLWQEVEEQNKKTA
jgi:hypothetical protein